MKNGKLIELSHDHKPENDGEMARIKAGGGFVEDGRVQGIIAVSRAIGDWEYKNPALLQQMEKKSSMKKRKSTKASTTATPAPEEAKLGPPYRNIEEAKKHQVSSYPDIKKVPIKKDEHDFIICACDGIWDCFTNQEAVKFVRQRRERGPKKGSESPVKGKSSKSLLNNAVKSPLAMKKGKSELSAPNKKIKTKGETSFIIEEMMDHGIAKGDISMSDGTGTDNMTCILI